MMKIVVRICSGTTCYVMGGSELLLLQESLTDEMKACVVIEGDLCLGFCRDQKTFGPPPYALVNKKRISGASIEALITEISCLMEAKVENY